MDFNRFGRKVCECRERIGLRQEDLAFKIGVSREFVCQVERAVRKPGLETAVKIAKALDASLDYLTS